MLPALFVSLAVLAAAGACSQDVAGAPDPVAVAAPKPAPKPEPPPVLAEATNPDVPVVVQVLEAKRVTADTVRVTLAFTNKASAEPPQPEPVPLFGETDPADFCLITVDGTRRMFILRDAENKPVLDGSLDPLKPGGRRVIQAMFPAPPGQAGKVSLLLGKVVLRDVPVSQ